MTIAYGSGAAQTRSGRRAPSAATTFASSSRGEKTGSPVAISDGAQVESTIAASVAASRADFGIMERGTIVQDVQAYLPALPDASPMGLNNGSGEARPSPLPRPSELQCGLEIEGPTRFVHLNHDGIEAVRAAQMRGIGD